MGVLYVKVEGTWQPILASASEPEPEAVGSMKMWSGLEATIPPKYLACDGTERLRSEFSDLFAIIGESWGAGDGSTTFNLPNWMDFFPMGGPLPGLQGGFLDATLVSHSHTQPTHTHTQAHTHVGAAHTHTINHNHGSTSAATATASNPWTNNVAGGGAIPGGANTNAMAQGSSHSHAIPNFTGTSGGASATTTGGASAANTGAGGNENVSTVGVAATGRNLPPFRTCLFIVRALP